MKTNNEIKIAFAVGAIMIAICLALFILKKTDKIDTTIDFKVYKHITTDPETKKGYYVECNVPTEKLVIINSDYKRIRKLDDKKKLTGKSINGDYKLESTNPKLIIAFDANGKDLVYRSDTTAIYNYKGDLYEIVKEACESTEINMQKVETNEVNK